MSDPRIDPHNDATRVPPRTTDPAAPYTTEPARSSNNTAFILGGLVVAVAIIAFVLWGASDDDGDLVVEETPAADVGAAADAAADNIGDAADDAAATIDNAGENIGDAANDAAATIDDAGDDAAATIDNAGDEAADAVEDATNDAEATETAPAGN